MASFGVVGNANIIDTGYGRHISLMYIISVEADEGISRRHWCHHFPDVSFCRCLQLVAADSIVWLVLYKVAPLSRIETISDWALLLVLTSACGHLM